MNVIRFIAICSVVWGHCLMGLENAVFHSAGYQIVQSMIVEAGRVGTIMFFIISGFFLADKIGRFTPLSYLRYRLYTVIVPWVFFLLLMVGIELFQLISSGAPSNSDSYTILKLTATLLKGAVFHATYWFIPVSIFSAMLLVALQRHIYKPWLAITLAILSLFYCINLYLAWIPVDHTMAILGYIFLCGWAFFLKSISSP